MGGEFRELISVFRLSEKNVVPVYRHNKSTVGPSLHVLYSIIICCSLVSF
jgi:hypothetical protein